MKEDNKIYERRKNSKRKFSMTIYAVRRQRNSGK